MLRLVQRARGPRYLIVKMPRMDAAFGPKFINDETFGRSGGSSQINVYCRGLKNYQHMVQYSEDGCSSMYLPYIPQNDVGNYRLLH